MSVVVVDIDLKLKTKFSGIKVLESNFYKLS